MRRAYVGISSPLAYDYANTFQVGPENVPEPYWSFYNARPYPNPILEAPYGILLLYDEVWFLSRALCPKNMQDLPYVKFLLESEYAESIYHRYVNYNDPALLERLLHLYGIHADLQRSPLEEYLQDIPFSWSPQLRRASEAFMLSGQALFGLAAAPVTVLIDLVHLSHIPLEIELVSNRFTTQLVEGLTERTSTQLATNSAQLAEAVLLERIPNYLSSVGPYHPIVDEARADPFLRNFRAWLASHPQRLTTQEIGEISQEANSTFKNLQNTLLVKHLSHRNYFEAIGKNLLYAGIDLAFSGLGTATSLVSEALTGRRSSQVRWQAFLASEELRRTRSSN